jgi:hypothetical protein
MPLIVRQTLHSLGLLSRKENRFRFVFECEHDHYLALPWASFAHPRLFLCAPQEKIRNVDILLPHFFLWCQRILTQSSTSTSFFRSLLAPAFEQS